MRRADGRLPLPGSFGVLSQVTRSCAAAWIAFHSSGATTPTKLPFCTTVTLGMCSTELLSSERTVAPWVSAAWPRGRTTRPWSIPGTRMFWA